MQKTSRYLGWQLWAGGKFILCGRWKGNDVAPMRPQAIGFLIYYVVSAIERDDLAKGFFRCWNDLANIVIGLFTSVVPCCQPVRRHFCLNQRQDWQIIAFCLRL
jgi:hypothetical protein